MSYVLAKSQNDEILKAGECGGAVTSIFKYLLDEGIVDVSLKGLSVLLEPDVIPVADGPQDAHFRAGVDTRDDAGIQRRTHAQVDVAARRVAYLGAAAAVL